MQMTDSAGQVVASGSLRSSWRKVVIVCTTVTIAVAYHHLSLQGDLVLISLLRGIVVPSEVTSYRRCHPCSVVFLSILMLMLILYL